MAEGGGGGGGGDVEVGGSNSAPMGLDSSRISNRAGIDVSHIGQRKTFLQRPYAPTRGCQQLALWSTFFLR